MKRERTEAIILHTFPSRERDKLVVFLTSDHGKKKGWAYGSRSMKNRFGAALEPLSKVRIGYLERETDEVVRIESVDLQRSLFDAHQNLASSMAATYIAETVDTFAQPDDPSETLYRLLDRSCEVLLGGGDPAYVVAYVEVWVLKLAGIFPSMKNCSHCHESLERPLRYDEQQNGFVCRNCAPRSLAVLPNDTTDAIELLMRSRTEDFAGGQHPDLSIFEIRSLARNVRRNFLGHELKSHDLLGGALARR
ncbi:MAG: DNA repair protein RecO [Acidobacteriota bacterium]